MRARLAWACAIFACLCGVADAAVTAAYRPLFSERSVAEHGFPFLTGAVVMTGLLGAVIVSRYERHPIGWLLTFTGATGSASILGEGYSIWVRTAGGPGSDALAGVVGWLSAMLGGQLAIGAIALIILLAPDGRLPSRRAVLVVLAVVTGELLMCVALSAGDITAFDVENAVRGQMRDGVLSAGFVLVILGLCGALVSMLVRLRRSDGIRRQQLRLIAAAAVVLLGGLVNLIVVQHLNGGHQTFASSVPLFAAFMLMPVFHTVAVLRYRLHDVEVIVNAALLFAVGTAFAAVGYVVVVVAVQDQIDSRAGGWAVSLAGTALVALAFQPLRRWVVHLANRLAYGPRARPYLALADFSGRLAESPRPDTLLPAVADAAGRAVSARGASVNLEIPTVGVLAASWGEARAETSAVPFDVPIRSDGHPLGGITVFIPRGRAMRPADLRLLQALADQAAMAFRNAALEAQLAERVSQLDRTTRELVESRERLIDANLEARRTLEAAISREVLPLLTALPARIHGVRGRVATGDADRDLLGLLDDTSSALESLRELTRGIFPTQLTRAGLEPSLRSRLARSGLASVLLVEESASGRRFPARTETAVYFCCAEAVRALDEHSSVVLSADHELLALHIRGVDAAQVDVQAVEDRTAAAGGWLEVGAHEVTLRIPVDQAGSGGEVAAAHAASSRSGPRDALGT